MSTAIGRLAKYDVRWQNQFNTFGTAADPVHRTVFGLTARIERTELESMYRHDWVARAVVDSLPNDSTREWLQVANAVHVPEDQGEGPVGVPLPSLENRGDVLTPVEALANRRHRPESQ